MPYDIRRTRRVEPDETRFVDVRDGARERCITCRGFLAPDEPRVPMPALGVIPAGNAHNRCASLARPGYDRALALGDNVRAKPAVLPRPLRRTA